MMEVQDYISDHRDPMDVEMVAPEDDGEEGVEGYRRYPYRRGWRYPRYGRRPYRPYWWRYPYSAQYMGYSPNLPAYYQPMKVQAPAPTPAPEPQPTHHHHEGKREGNNMMWFIGIGLAIALVAILVAAKKK